MTSVAGPAESHRRDHGPSLSAVVAVVGLVALPLLLYIVMLQTFWDRGELSIDLTQTLLPAAREIADGYSPYPAYGYPPLVAFALTPLTLVPSPELVWTMVLLFLLPASLWVLRVRDWRCYGAAFLWGASFHAVQTGNVTIPLLFLTALAWRTRDSVYTGVWGGLAVATKIICWPLAVWLASTRRLGAAVMLVLVAGGVTFGLWGLLGFSGLIDYPSSLDKLEAAQTGSSYTIRALLEDLGIPGLGQVVWYGLVLFVLVWCVIAGRRRDDRLSFSLAVLACVVASPIVWLHSFVLLLAPVAIYRPRLGIVWVLPALLWFGSGTGNGEVWQTALVLAVAGLTFVLAVGSRTGRQPPWPRV
jgi:Glycosyltransferase family 87